MSTEIDPSSCSDEDIIKFIEEVRGDDTLHYKSNWIVIRVLKILVRDYLERKRAIKYDIKPGTLTEEEKKELDELGAKTPDIGHAT